MPFLLVHFFQIGRKIILVSALLAVCLIQSGQLSLAQESPGLFKGKKNQVIVAHPEDPEVVDDQNLLKSVMKLTGNATDAPPAAEFVQKARRGKNSDLQFIPVHANHTDRAVHVLSSSEVQSNSAALDSIAQQHQQLSTSKAPPADKGLVQALEAAQKIAREEAERRAKLEQEHGFGFQGGSSF